MTIFVFVMLLWGQAQAAACAPDDVTASCIFVRPMYATFGPWAWAGVAVMTVMSLLVTGVLVVRGTRR